MLAGQRMVRAQLREDRHHDAPQQIASLGVVGLADENGFLLQRHRVELHGLCRDCQQRDLEALRA